MTFSQLALSNVRGSALRYAAFFLSCTFSVTLFYVYAQFILHPDVVGGDIYGGSSTRVVLAVCEVLVAVFAFFFVLYSSGAFLRARNHEFGLLTLLGTTRAQLRRLIWVENTVISTVAIGAGIALGLLLSRLFSLGIGRVLDLETPVRFALVPSALLLTVVSFLALFQLVTWVAGLRIGRLEIVELLRAARQPRSVPRASFWLGLLGVGAILAGYFLASVAEGEGVVTVFLPVVALVVTGTYLTLTHGSVLVLRLLARAKAGYLRGTRMLVVSQLLFRVRDNARLLATIAVLSTVVLSAAGSFYIISRGFESGAAYAAQLELAFLEGAPTGAGLTPERVDAILAEGGVAPSLRAPLTITELPLASGEGTVNLVGRAEYDSLAARLGFDPEAGATETTVRFEGGRVSLGDGGMPALAVRPPLAVPPLLFGEWYVVDGALPALAPDAAGAGEQTLWLYDWPGGRARNRIEPALQEEIMAVTAREYVEASFLGVRQVKQALGLSLFAGVFVSLLFFVGAASLIYFKLFTELADDRRLHWRLRRLGVTPGESARVVTAQIAVIFLVPFLLGGLHALVALRALGALLEYNVMGYGLAVVALFAAVQAFFFLLARSTYLRALRPEAGQGAYVGAPVRGNEAPPVLSFPRP